MQFSTRRSLLSWTVLVVFWGGCASESPDPGPPFIEVASQVGLDFVHFNGMSGEFYFCETVGPGGALLDYDRDGDLDVYLVQGQMLGPGKSPAEAVFAPPSPPPLSDRLFRNMLAEEGSLRFEDVTEAAAIASHGYGMGVAAGDFDSDGWVDLYVTNFGSNLLLRNTGRGSFEDVTVASGTDDRRWSTSAAFVDFDADGHLDLFVCNYVDFTFASHKPCFSETSAQDYCDPRSYSPYPDRLLRNRGDGSFEDVTAASQIARHYGAGLGVVPADLNGDSLVDLYVANDGHPNQLWINQGDGTFRNDALLAGCAFNMDGRAEASMGIDAGDYDNDGDEDLFMTHLTTETNTLYRNDGRAFFEDHTFRADLGVASRAFTGFGAAWIDYDSDGWKDLFVANGAVKTIEEQARAGEKFPLRQQNQLFRNRGDDRFEDRTAAAGPAFELAEVSRGAAFGDVDNDGDVDVLVTNNSGPVRLLLNQARGDRHWIGFQVLDRGGRTTVPATRIELIRSDGSSLWSRVRVAASYCSANDPRVVIGLGSDPAPRAVRAHWPGGEIEQWDLSEVDRYIPLQRGTGQAVEGS